MTKVLVIGPTGNLGPHIIKELVKNGKEVSALVRPASMQDGEKMAPLRNAGVNIIPGDMDDPTSLEKACEGQDVVVSCAGGGQIMQQADLAAAAVKAGVRRFIPSEFGVDPFAVPSGTCDLFDVKAAAQEKIKETGIGFTPIYTNGFMEFWSTGLGQLGPTSPPEEVQVFGDGNTMSYQVALSDIAKYVNAIIDDESTNNREVTIRANQVTQNELIDTWQRISGKNISRQSVNGAQLENIISNANSPEDFMTKVFTQLHKSMWIDGCSKYQRDGQIEATERYPQIKPVGVQDYLGYFIK